MGVSPTNPSASSMAPGPALPAGESKRLGLRGKTQIPKSRQRGAYIVPPRIQRENPAHSNDAQPDFLKQTVTNEEIQQAYLEVMSLREPASSEPSQMMNPGVIYQTAPMYIVHGPSMAPMSWMLLPHIHLLGPLNHPNFVQMGAIPVEQSSSLPQYLHQNQLPNNCLPAPATPHQQEGYLDGFDFCDAALSLNRKDDRFVEKFLEEKGRKPTDEEWEAWRCAVERENRYISWQEVGDESWLGLDDTHPTSPGNVAV